jgi:geranyl-CoA carboxylase alpha subunit
MTSTPFQKILIANRGEIALRILRSARSLGYRTVAVYSTADAQARHALEADEAVCIGEPLPAQSYLNIPAILAAARQTGADAIHPGYGFLAENEDFAQACRDAGLVFIGPSPESIRAMGHKAEAKRLMQKAGVPCVPGYDGDDQSAERLVQEAQRIGYPVMIKATAGGGGRGMRKVEQAEAFADALRSAQSEALNAFGSAQVLLERAIVEPRHIEIQVFADRHGNAVHLGERDCSVQRRHQKVIEESPSPAVSAALRERMGLTAVQAVQALGYEGAGTLEFLLDASGEFYFMEMNTRLQVEHPVTEAVTGLDLVEWQLRVAAGEALPLLQSQIAFHGHAIEVRLCAEDPGKGFMPQSGQFCAWAPATALRVEHALAADSEVPPYYDSMVAKLISHGAHRDEALRRLRSGLQDTVALGVTTNQAFLDRCLAHPAFVAGQATTGFIATHQEALLGTPEGLLARALTLVAWLSVDGHPQAQHAAPLVPRLPMQLQLAVQEQSFSVQVTRQLDGSFEVAGALSEGHGFKHSVRGVHRSGHSLRYTLDGVATTATVLQDASDWWLQLGAEAVRVSDLTRVPAARQGAAGGDGRVRASTNGRVVAVQVTVGQRVEAGVAVVTLEAMKMEHVHVARAAGTVRAVHVSEGVQAAAGSVLVEVDLEKS